MKDSSKTIRIRVKRSDLMALVRSCVMIEFDPEYDPETRRIYRDLHDRIKQILQKWEVQDDNK